MTPARFRQVEEVFHHAADLPAEHRAAYLDTACAGDLDLRQEVEALLHHHADAGEQLADVVSGAAANLNAQTTTQRIGAYELVKEIGRGGMGAVYKARRADDLFEHFVAIKLLRRGMDSDFFLSRFRAERQILASLQHPNIAALLDGGTSTDGQPYFVLEYIDGLPLLAYCESRRLDLRQRLEIFLQVCAAISCAHRQLVIHRDIKPANILVTADGIAKLLDFGIAKLLDDTPIPSDLAQTRTGVRLMTAEYASPEQVRGEMLTTGTDVYSLGVVLYELVSGARPYAVTGISPRQIEDAVCELEPPPPSAVARHAKLKRELRGDLDNVVGMAMRKDPARRYTSVEQFAEDIRRYLNGFPVVARRDSIRYRTIKMLQRNKLAAAALFAVFVTLIGGIAATTYQARRAERRFQQVRKLANTFLFDFHDQIRVLPGSLKARETVVRTALEYLDNLAQEASGDTDLQWELAVAYRRVGDIQGYPSAANLGQTEAALKSYAKAIALGEAAAKSGNAPPAKLAQLAQTYNRAGYVHFMSGDSKTAMEFYHHGFDMARRAYGDQPKVAEGYAFLLNSRILLGDRLAASGQQREALKMYKEAVALAEQEQQKFPSKRATSSLASSLGRLEWQYIEVGDPNSAIDALNRAIAIREAQLRETPNSTSYRRELAYVLAERCLIHTDPEFFATTDAAKAQRDCGRAVELVEQNHQADATDAQAQYDVGFRRLGYARALLLTDARRAMEVLDSTIPLWTGLAQTKFLLGWVRCNRGVQATLSGKVLREQNRQADAKARLIEALGILEPLAVEPKGEAEFRQHLIRAYLELAAVEAPANAVIVLTKALQVAEPAAQGWRSATASHNLARVHEELAATHHRLGDTQAAEQYRQKAKAIWTEWPKWYTQTEYIQRKSALLN